MIMMIMMMPTTMTMIMMMTTMIMIIMMLPTTMMMMITMIMKRTPVRVKLPVLGSFEKVDLVVLRPDHGCIYVAWNSTEALVQRLGVAAVQFAKG